MAIWIITNRLKIPHLQMHYYCSFTVFILNEDNSLYFHFFLSIFSPKYLKNVFHLFSCISMNLWVFACPHCLQGQSLTKKYSLIILIKHISVSKNGDLCITSQEHIIAQHLLERLKWYKLLYNVGSKLQVWVANHNGSLSHRT